MVDNEIFKRNIQNNFSNYYKNHNFQDINIDEWIINDFNVIVGTNGCGKTNFLKVLRETITDSINYPVAKYVVRFLSFGRESENYDPNKRKHPLIDSHYLNNIFNELKIYGNFFFLFYFFSLILNLFSPNFIKI